MKALILLLTVCASLAFSGARERAEQKEQQLAFAKQTLENARDSLQAEIAKRYGLKQQAVEQRATDKEEFDRLLEKQEQIANDLARVKEECLTQEQALQDEKKIADTKSEEWGFVQGALGEVLQKEADATLESFPLDVEKRRGALEDIRQTFQSRKDVVDAWRTFTSYQRNRFRNQDTVSLLTQRVLPDEGESRLLTIARFGSVFAYGVDSLGQAYMFRQTGRLGADRYAIERVAASELVNFLQTAMPQWIRKSRPEGDVVTEVLQNEQSRLLVLGKQSSYWRDFYLSLRAGGAIMVPLLLLPLWALALVIRKGGQVLSRRRNMKRDFDAVMRLVDRKEFDSAVSYVKGAEGIMARILEACLLHRGHDRAEGERVVRELILQEVPVLNRYMNTLAVIAGAAPLMGLLGTISGMITLFAAVTHYGTGDPKFLAGGISEALITAKTGLAIAIPVLFIHDFLRNTKDHLLADVERLSIATMNKLWTEE